MITEQDIALFEKEMSERQLKNLPDRFSNRVELERKAYEAYKNESPEKDETAIAR